MSIKTILQTIKKHKTFLVSTHVGPDPDALCSELAVAMFLKRLGKKVYMVNEECVPERYLFLPGSSGIKSCKDIKKIEVDVIVVVDCGDLNRIGKVQKLITGKEVIINIDHHITNDRFGHLNLVEPKASSTAEVLYGLFTSAGVKLNKNMAEHLYLGIMTDTGSFRYENTTSRTFQITSELAKFPFSTFELYQKIYERIPYRDLTHVAAIISHVDAEFDGKVIFVVLTKKDMSKFSENFDLRDTIFKLLRSVEGVEVIAILSEVESKKTRINLRSNRFFDVAKLASVYGGGGHKRASGCTVDKKIQDAYKELKKCIKSML